MLLHWSIRLFKHRLLDSELLQFFGTTRAWFMWLMSKKKITIVQLAPQICKANTTGRQGRAGGETIGGSASDIGLERFCLHFGHSVVYWFVYFPNNRRPEPGKVNKRGGKSLSAHKAKPLESEISHFHKQWYTNFSRIKHRFIEP